jgi:hypothetical protein
MLIATKQVKTYQSKCNKFIPNIPQITNTKMVKLSDKFNYL